MKLQRLRSLFGIRRETQETYETSSSSAERSGQQSFDALRVPEAGARDQQQRGMMEEQNQQLRRETKGVIVWFQCLFVAGQGGQASDQGKACTYEALVVEEQDWFLF